MLRYFFALSLCPVPAFADEFLAPEIAFFEAGVMCAGQDVGTRDAPDTVAGSTHIVDKAPPFVSNGRLVPAVIGVGFGALAAVQGDAGLEGVRIYISHPPFAGIDATEQSFVSFIGPEADPGVSFYQFDFGYELALGDWVIEARFEDYVLYRTEFTVVPAEALPDLAGVCGYVDLLS